MKSVGSASRQLAGGLSPSSDQAAMWGLSQWAGPPICEGPTPRCITPVPLIAAVRGEETTRAPAAPGVMGRMLGPPIG